MFTKKFLSLIVLSACLTNASYAPKEYGAASPVVAPAPMYGEASPASMDEYSTPVEEEVEIPEESPAAYMPKEEASPVEEGYPEVEIPEESPAAYMPKEEASPAEESYPEEEIPEESPAAYVPVAPVEETVPAATPCVTPSEEKLYEMDHDYASPDAPEEETTELSETGYEAPAPEPVEPEATSTYYGEEEMVSDGEETVDEYVPETIVHDNVNDYEYNAEDVINEEAQLSEQDKAYEHVVHDNVNDNEYNAEDVITELECEDEEEVVAVPTPTPCTSTYEMAEEETVVEDKASPAGAYEAEVDEAVGYDEAAADEAVTSEFQVSASSSTLSASNVAGIAVGSVAAVTVLGVLVWRHKKKGANHNEMPITPFVESQI